MWHSRSCHHTLYPCPCCFLEASIVTIPPFQDSCPHESDQNFQLSYHMHSHYLFARAYDYLILVVDGYEVWFVWWTSLIHWYLMPVSWCISVPFSVHECHCYFFPKLWILFSSRFEGLVVWWWSKYPGLWWSLHEFHILGKIFDFVCYKTHGGGWCCFWWNLVWPYQYNFFILYCSPFFFCLFIHI